MNIRGRRRRVQVPRSEVVQAQSWQDVADDRGRMAVGLDLPDTYVARAHPEVAADARAMVSDLVARALSRGALDEHVSDVADARIQTAREVWDAQAVRAWPARVRTAAQLYAIELQNLATVEQAVAARRAEVEQLTSAVNGWRAVLLGQTEHAPALAQRPAALPARTEAGVPVRPVTLDSPLAELLRRASDDLTTRSGAQERGERRHLELAAVDGRTRRATPAPEDMEVAR